MAIIKNQKDYYNPNNPGTAKYVRGISNDWGSGNSNSGTKKGNQINSNYQQKLAELLGQYNAGATKLQAVNDAYAQKKQLLMDNYNAGKKALQDQYNFSKNQVTKDASKSLKEAYINKMLTMKDLGQQMSAQGLSGGATESTIAGVENNYGNARNAIDTTRNENIAALNNTFQNNLSSLTQQYNNALADAETQRAALQAQIEADAGTTVDMSALLAENSDFMNQLKASLQNQGSFEAKGVDAINKTQTIDTQQQAMGNNDNATNYARWLNLAQLWAKNNPNVGADVIVNGLVNNGADNASIQKILAQLS